MHPDIIVIGASTGGIEALKVVIAGLPADLQASVLIVQHIGASSPGVLPDILAKATPMRVCKPGNGEKLAHGRIYVAPPDRHLIVENAGELRLGRGPKENRARPAIDPLFRSAALAFHSRVIGVVLTGHLDDGAAGLQAIKLCGGTAVVQDPKDAVAASMPANALASVAVDYCLPLAKIGPLLMKLVSTDIPETPGSAFVEGRLALETMFASGRSPPLEAVGQWGEPSCLPSTPATHRP